MRESGKWFGRDAEGNEKLRRMKRNEWSALNNTVLDDADNDKIRLINFENNLIRG